MKRLRVNNNERGLTLVEILASLVILGIVFVGFMTVFPQMTNFNEKTKTKLLAMNEARILLSDFKEEKDYTYESFTPDEGYIVKNNEAWVHTVDNENSTVEYWITKSPALVAGNAEGEMNLHEVFISIKKDGKVISKTFGYIEVKN